MTTRPTMRGGLASHRQHVLYLSKLLILALGNVPLIQAVPIQWQKYASSMRSQDGESSDTPTLWIYLIVAIGLVVLGGAFAGLTIALMGQEDEIYLQVIRTSGDPKEKRHAAQVLRLLERGKHWVLVTLLLGNVITNETLPIVLDRSLGGGWPAVLGSTALVVIFGEIIPQSICVRYGLPIGAWMSPLVLVLMYVLSPIAWPTAKLLDRLLGEEHGTTYKKAGLKTLVTLHKTLGSAGEQLNADEVTIISAVLDLKEKPIGSIMTPMDDVFTMSADTILDEKTMDSILSAGYSRIPIHAPDNDLNFVGMLLVKILITYDPEDCKSVRDFALATLPETDPETSCLDIVNFFQEGKSHMVLVSTKPGTDEGALGVVTLEDVIEELIGEEIIDESDVFIDVHRAIRRMTPAPRLRYPRPVKKGEIVMDPPHNATGADENLIDLGEEQAAIKSKQEDPSLGKEISDSPKRTPFTRRTSSVAGSDVGGPRRRVDDPSFFEHLKHLGPSNLASRPLATRYQTVKIKPGGGVAHEVVRANSATPIVTLSQFARAAPSSVGDGLLASAGRPGKDGVQSTQPGYGSISVSPHTRTINTQINGLGRASTKSERNGTISTLRYRDNPDAVSPGEHEEVISTIGDLPQRKRASIGRLGRGAARSGIIMESVVDQGGIRKVVLETTSSSEEVLGGNDGEDGERDAGLDGNEDAEEESTSGAKRRRRRRKRKDEGAESGNGEVEKNRK